MKKIREETFSDKRRFIQIGRIEGAILAFLIRMNKVKTIVEVGTLVGYSAICMAKAVGNGGKVYTIEKNSEYAQIALQNFSTFPQIELFIGDAKIKLLELNSFGPFDMLFIDAEKSGYPTYLEWGEANVRVGGLIIADNTLGFGKNNPSSNSRAWQFMERFNTMISDSDKYDSVILPTTNGLTIATKK
ncbi:O-methyltransferase family protein [Neorickettsia risticii str. Illinois]|uniref:O-methyltransferase family protein n=2 Tax=Neorickettsia risticii TaxID=950 RepID=C6V583_NEORI|nr:O-methyltransferase family protein [Neorickettsia risticii str. Illinois]